MIIKNPLRHAAPGVKHKAVPYLGDPEELRAVIAEKTAGVFY
jgi:hypothetical protein